MNVSEILATLKKGVDFAETMAPIAVALGGPVVSTVIGTVKTISEIANNINERAKEGTVVFGDGDQSEIDAIVQRLASVNDKLAEAIASS